MHSQNQLGALGEKRGAVDIVRILHVNLSRREWINVFLIIQLENKIVHLY